MVYIFCPPAQTSEHENPGVHNQERFAMIETNSFAANRSYSTANQQWKKNGAEISER